MATRTQLNINVASTEELEEILGLEPDLAQGIVDHRHLNGPFHSIEDLKEVEGITEEMINSMLRSGITLD